MTDLLLPLCGSVVFLCYKYNKNIRSTVLTITN